MKLLHPLSIANPHWNSAPYYLIQHAYIETAISSAIEILGRQRDKEQANESDPLISSFTTTMHDWLVETLVQGAYMREYHVWEKHVKAYLNDQRRWNGGRDIVWRKGGTDMVQRAVSYLSEFGVTIGERIVQAINVMREKVNAMKHEEGLLDEHFVTLDDYLAAHQAIEGFWDQLSQIEKPVMSLSEAC